MSKTVEGVQNKLWKSRRMIKHARIIFPPLPTQGDHRASSSNMGVFEMPTAAQLRAGEVFSALMPLDAPGERLELRGI